MNQELWKTIDKYCRESIANRFNASNLISTVLPTIEEPHHGFYIGLISASGKELGRGGVLRSVKANTLDLSADIKDAVDNLYQTLKSSHVDENTAKVSSVFLTVLRGFEYIEDPMKWDDSKDGVYFAWGEKYRAFYLPYQIRLMAVSKIETMDRLCSFEAHVPANLWRLPEGMVYKILCESYPV
jgi:AMMECR1 domain-containing protein